MRKGKMAAQSAHAAQKFLIEAMRVEGNKRVLSGPVKDQFEAWASMDFPLEIRMVKDHLEMEEAIDKSLPFSKVIDSGRTEFAGVATLTCASQGVLTDSPDNELLVPENIGQDIKAKQIYVFSKQNPLSKEKACFLSAKGCLLFHRKKMVEDGDKLVLDIDPFSEFGMWVSGAFGKIALGVPTDLELIELKHQLDGFGIKSIMVRENENSCLILEPKSPENVDPYTRHLGLI